MITPSSILKEIEAAKKINAVKVSLLKVLVITSIAAFAGHFYFDFMLPVSKRVEMIPVISNKVESLDSSIRVGVMPQDTTINQVIRTMQNDVIALKRSSSEINQKLIIIKEEVRTVAPKIEQRFDDLQKGYLYNEKKNDSLWIRYASQ